MWRCERCFELCSKRFLTLNAMTFPRESCLCILVDILFNPIHVISCFPETQVLGTESIQR